MGALHRKIVLLEDDWVLSHTIAKVLSVRGYQCVTPRTIELLFAALNQGDVSLIISDLTLPWLNTLELCRLVKHAKHLNHTPFVFISGASDDKLVKQAFLQGCDDFLSKPFHIQELITAIELLVRIHPLQREV